MLGDDQVRFAGAWPLGQVLDLSGAACAIEHQGREATLAHERPRRLQPRTHLLPREAVIRFRCHGLGGMARPHRCSRNPEACRFAAKRASMMSSALPRVIVVPWLRAYSILSWAALVGMSTLRLT